MSFVSWPFLLLWHDREKKRGESRLLLFFISIISCFKYIPQTSTPKNRESRTCGYLGIWQKKKKHPDNKRAMLSFSSSDLGSETSNHSNKRLLKTVNTKVWQRRCLLVRQVFSLAQITTTKIKSHYQYLWQTMCGWNVRYTVYPKLTPHPGKHTNTALTSDILIQHLHNILNNASKGKADCVRNQNLYEICLDWAASENTNTHIFSLENMQGAGSSPVRWWNLICLYFPVSVWDSFKGCQRWVLITKTIYTHKLSVSLS